MTAGSGVPYAGIANAVSLHMNIHVDQAKILLVQVFPLSLKIVPIYIRPQIMRPAPGAPNARVGIGHGCLQAFSLATDTILASYNKRTFSERPIHPTFGLIMPEFLQIVNNYHYQVAGAQSFPRTQDAERLAVGAFIRGRFLEKASARIMGRGCSLLPTRDDVGSGELVALV